MAFRKAGKIKGLSWRQQKNVEKMMRAAEDANEMTASHGRKERDFGQKLDKAYEVGRKARIWR